MSEIKIRMFCEIHPVRLLKTHKQTTALGGVDFFVYPCPECGENAVKTHLLNKEPTEKSPYDNEEH